MATDSQGAVRITINHHAASVKTRRRVKKNGPIFEWFDNSSREGEIFLRAPLTGWTGWLPLAEIEMKPV